VRLHLSIFIHLNTVDTNKGDITKWTKKNALGHLNTVKTSAWLWAPNERRVANIDARDISILVLPDSEEKTTKKEKTKAEGLKVEAKETCEEDLPDNTPCAEEEEPPEDGWFAPIVRNRSVSSYSGRKSSRGLSTA
jgi:hypothetical protein